MIEASEPGNKRGLQARIEQVFSKSRNPRYQLLVQDNVLQLRKKHDITAAHP